LLSPWIEVGGLVLMAVAFALGMMSGTGFLAFMVAAFALGVMLSATSILLEELSFRTYPKRGHVLVLFAVSLLENFGYRQLASFWRLQALISWFAGRPIHWGVMKRKATGSSNRRGQSPSIQTWRRARAVAPVAEGGEEGDRRAAASPLRASA
jgi:hypothetical protein